MRKEFRAPMDRFAGRHLRCIRGERVVFSGLDFAVETGQALVLVGPNGSGKSSLLRLLAGLLRPAQGAMTWNDEDIAGDPEAHGARLHYVGHLDAVKPVFSVMENVAFWTGLTGKGGDGSVAAALEGFGIAHLAGVPGRYLSAGQRRRVNLARILTAPAPLWLLDEPTTALDRAAVGNLQDAVARHRAEGGIVVVATHADIGLKDARTLDLARFEAREVA